MTDLLLPNIARPLFVRAMVVVSWLLLKHFSLGYCTFCQLNFGADPKILLNPPRLEGISYAIRLVVVLGDHSGLQADQLI
ncbi:hypothetical protein EDB81DRAFT_830634 [Dactylonectria macrodidyma]|uniref:Uncharacterized protein n=1 Tax=Dactylonectria macrodidyma TaxID=307937 RepID=A0A9P9D2F6_9HYPO|nr:hypothetical protein EDB81DRAFT_830634 [Dactylonectria macrodidyma]